MTYYHNPYNPYIDPQDIEEKNSPGYIYLIEAVGFHGLFPGRLIRRCKIGLSKDPERRLKRFKHSQFPCDVRILNTIFVEDMAEVENLFHKKFERCNVKMEVSQEWFDLSPWQYARVYWEFFYNATHIWSFADIPKRVLVGGIIALLGIGVIAGSGISLTLEADNTNQIQEVKNDNIN